MAVAGRDKRLFQLSWNFFSYLKGEEEKNKIKENNFQRLLEYFFYPFENIPGSALFFLFLSFFLSLTKFLLINIVIWTLLFKEHIRI
jgi:hypothetical protein